MKSLFIFLLGLVFTNNTMERPPAAAERPAKSARVSVEAQQETPPYTPVHSPEPRASISHPASPSASDGSATPAGSSKRKQAAPVRAFKKSRGQEESFSIRYYLMKNPEMIRSRIKGNTLDLSYMNISSLDGLLQIPRITQMNHLILAHNLIKEIKREDFATLKQVITLDLSNNLLEFVYADSFVELENLTNLFLNDNIIRAIQHDALAGLNHLKQLSLSHNKIKEIDAKMLHGAFNLEILDLSNNEIKVIAPHTFVRVTFLKRLELNGNQLSGLTKNIFDVPKAEGYINIRAKKAPPFQLRSLEILNLRDNKFTEMPTSILSSMPALQQLLLTNNLIAGVSDANINALKKVSTLKIIDLVNNQLTDTSLNKLKKALPQVQIIATVAMEPTLQIEQLAQLSREKRLKEQQTEESAIENLGKVSAARSLSNIEQALEQEEAKEEAVLGLTSVASPLYAYLKDRVHDFWQLVHGSRGQQWYDLNKLGIANLQGLVDLPYIHDVYRIFLRNNQIKTVPVHAFAGLNKLEDVDLGANQIESFDPHAFEGAPHLESVYLNANRIKTLTPEIMAQFKNMKTLILEENQISQLPSGIFKDLTNLTTLYLGHNPLTQLTPEMLIGLDNLKTLDLNSNRFTYLDPALFIPLKKLTYLNLAANPLSKENAEAIRKALPGVRVIF